MQQHPVCWFFIVFCVLPALSLLAGIASGAPGAASALGHYKVHFSGLPSREMLKVFREGSDTWNFRKSPPPTRSLLNVRVGRDREFWLRYLKTHGYYNAAITWRIEGPDSRVRVLVDVETGEPFLFGNVTVRLADDQREEEDSILLPDRAALGLLEGKAARHQKIIGAQSLLMSDIRRQGYPFARSVSREVVVDYATERMHVEFVVEAGAFARFGSLSIEGLDRVKEKFVTDQLTWREGRSYSPDRVQEFRDSLNRSGLFSIVQLTRAGELDEAGRLDWHLSLTESKVKSVGVGLGYNTTWGVGTVLNWEHRNLWGGGERFNVEANVAEKLTQGEANYEVPSFFSRHVSLRLQSRLANDRPPAYESLYWRNLGGMVWRTSRQVALGASLVSKASQIKQFGETKEYKLLSSPVYISFDYRNDPVEPTYGGALFFEVEPFAHLTDETSFMRERLRFLQLFKVWNHPRVLVSGQLGLGGIQGVGTGGVPPDERFYAGGSDTVRGYAFQRVGPKRDGVPTGGRSLLTLSGELCITIFEPIALVGFIDGGNVFDDLLPESYSDLQWGTGAGLRVFSAVGAIGVEVGFPLDRQDGDDPYQFYISVGYQF